MIELMPPRQSHLTTREGEIPAAIDALGKVPIACNTLTLTIAGPSSADPVPAEDGAAQGDIVLTTLSGTVASASPSVRIVTLEAPVEGVSTIALLDDTEVRSSEGAELTLNELQPGTQIEALGHPGDSDALLAVEMRVLDQAIDLLAGPAR